MPIVVTVALLADVAGAIVAEGATRGLLAVAALMLVGVQVVSQFGNVPINKVVGRMRPAALGPDWSDPRPVWRSWHLLRTTFAMTALLLSVAAALV
jgi:hypothetical protein